MSQRRPQSPPLAWFAIRLTRLLFPLIAPAETQCSTLAQQIPEGLACQTQRLTCEVDRRYMY